MSVIDTDIKQLLRRYQLLLLDAYGVLLDQQGPLPGAIDLIQQLNHEQHSYAILSNSASRQPKEFSDMLFQAGLEIPANRIVTSGSLLKQHFAMNRLHGARCVVLGPEGSREYVRQAGGELVSWESEAEVIVIADQAGFPLLEGLNGVVSLLLRRLDRGAPVELILCNPDLIYPLSPQQYGITAGSLALMLEGIVRERYADAPLAFTRLGKPYCPIFKAALGNYPPESAVMIGDQLGTDILGARRCGIDSALIMTGLALASHQAETKPTFRLQSLLSHTA